MCSHGPLTVIFGALLHITQHYTTLHYTRVLSCFHPTFWEIWEHFGKKIKALKIFVNVKNGGACTKSCG